MKIRAQIDLTNAEVLDILTSKLIERTLYSRDLPHGQAACLTQLDDGSGYRVMWEDRVEEPIGEPVPITIKPEAPETVLPPVASAAS